MKKVISIIAALTICLTLSACSPASKSEPHKFEGLIFVHSVGDYISNIDSFDDIELISDLIVEGEFIDDASVCYEEYRYSDHFGKDILEDIVSYCPMKVTKVLSGDAKVGDVINVVQEEGIWEDRFISHSPLTPMQKGDEWIFCLRRSESKHYEGYLCVAGSWGRYPTSNSKSNEMMCFSDYPELGVYERNNFNDNLYSELVEKYGT